MAMQRSERLYAPKFLDWCDYMTDTLIQVESETRKYDEIYAPIATLRSSTVR